jgi:hypothetical protein
MTSKRIPLIVLLVILMAVPAAAGNTQKRNAALVSAGKWLRLIDSGKYGESWNEAAEFFRNSVSREQWSQSLMSVRKPLGRLISRKVKTKTYTTSLPGAPDGEYVVIQFKTSFEYKQSAIETVAPMIEGDGKWRVSGYYIK